MKNENHWQHFITELKQLDFVKNHPFHPSGYCYYIRNGIANVQHGNSFIIGDAAGLATRDMGEGIGPAVKSGILAANAIISGKPLLLNSVRKYSFPRFYTIIKLLYHFIKTK